MNLITETPEILLIPIVVLAAASVASLLEAGLLSALKWASFQRGLAFALACNLAGALVMVLLALFALGVALSDIGSFGTRDYADETRIGTLILAAPIFFLLLRAALARAFKLDMKGCAAWLYLVPASIVTWITPLLALPLAVWLVDQIVQ